jgi:putative transposase
MPKVTLLKSPPEARLIWTRKLSNNAGSVALRSIPVGGSTIRSKMEPESVKLASSKTTENRPNGFEMPTPTGINQLYQAGFTKLPITDHRPHFVLAVMDCFSRYLLVLVVSSTTTTQDLTQGLDAALREVRKKSDLSKDKVITLATDNGPTFTGPEFSKYISGSVFRHVPCTVRPFQSLGMIKRVLWTLKDKEMSLREYRDPIEAQFWLERFRHIYNHERPHQALHYRFPGDSFCRKSRASA